jgi:nucleoid DNA-binding protein
MDIALLSKMIKEIVLDEDEVTLPGIGTFIAEGVPSSFSDKGYTINPPYRRLYFTQKQGSDTFLSDFYARSNSVSRETAARITTAFLQELKGKLQERKAIVFPGLGRLRATRENYFFFVPDEDLDIYPYAFGLERISLKTHVETEDEVAEAVGSLTKMLEEPAEGKIPEPVRSDAQEVRNDAQEARSDAHEDGDDTRRQAHRPVEAPAARRYLGWRIVLWILIGVFAVAALALGVFLVVAQFFPDFIDTILYSPEELEMIRSMQL